MRRLTTTLVVLAAIVAMSALTTDAQLTFASIPKRHSRSQDSRRSIHDDGDDTSGSTERSVKTQTAVKEEGYSFADLPVSSNVGGYAQKQPAIPAATKPISGANGATNNTAVKPLGKSQAAGMPLTSEPPVYSEDNDPAQSDPDTPSPSPSKATPAPESLGKSQAAGKPVTPKSTASSEDTDPTQSDLEIPSKTPSGASLGESQMAGHSVKTTPTPAPTATYDDGDDYEDDESEEYGDDEESDDGTPVPSIDDASNPKQSDV